MFVTSAALCGSPFDQDPSSAAFCGLVLTCVAQFFRNSAQNLATVVGNRINLSNLVDLESILDPRRIDFSDFSMVFRSSWPFRSKK